MISSTEGYVIVDEKDDLLFSTLASNRKQSWESFFWYLNYRIIYASRDIAKRAGFKCVRVSLQTEDYKR